MAGVHRCDQATSVGRCGLIEVDGGVWWQWCWRWWGRGWWPGWCLQWWRWRYGHYRHSKQMSGRCQRKGPVQGTSARDQAQGPGLMHAGVCATGCIPGLLSCPKDVALNKTHTCQCHLHIAGLLSNALLSPAGHHIMHAADHHIMHTAGSSALWLPANAHGSHMITSTTA